MTLSLAVAFGVIIGCSSALLGISLVAIGYHLRQR